MTADSNLQPLGIVGNEFRLMVGKIDRRMDDAPPTTGVIYNIFDLVDEHLSLLVDCVEDFADAVSEGHRLATDERDEHYRRVSYRMNAELDGILDGYDDLRSLNADYDVYEGWSLLVEIYDETLIQIRGWLEEVAECYEDPIAALRKRGLPTDGSEPINLSLVMKAPRQMKRLTRWQQRHGRQLAIAEDEAWAREQRRVAHRTGLIAGSMIGWWLGKD